MMPTIRIEDDVFAGLQSLAKPFTDTPNTVIRRLLEGCGALPNAPATQRSTESPRETRTGVRTASSDARARGLTPQPTYEKFLLHVLATQFKGKGDKHEVTKAVLTLMKARGFLGPADFKDVSSGETRAENTIAWGRNALKERGLIVRDSRRGTWELTPAGLKEGQSTVLPSAGG